MSLVYPSHFASINEPGGMPVKAEAWRTVSREIAVTLAHRLEKASVAKLVPITYHLE